MCECAFRTRSSSSWAHGLGGSTHTPGERAAPRSWASLGCSTWLSEHARQRLKQSWFIIPQNKKSTRKKVLDWLIQGSATATGRRLRPRTLPCFCPASPCLVAISSRMVPSWLLWHRESQVSPWHPTSQKTSSKDGRGAVSHIIILLSSWA